ncbi:MAG: hypothetical protein BAJALOKI2v1_960017 [Promethearchaeota archaeon]|nr:MAG: hypothetical protein BAJALOKI2v1_960017 [Candidatus Lokiarchaeota archaeon]
MIILIIYLIRTLFSLKKLIILPLSRVLGTATWSPEAKGVGTTV